MDKGESIFHRRRSLSVTIHPNNAARRKSRLMKKLNQAQASSEAEIPELEESEETEQTEQ